MTNETIHKRWYDRQPRLAQAVRFLSLFPDEIKSIISDGVVLIANREFQVAEQMKSFRTLGTEKVMGLHKSKNKRREYDQNETLHKAMNYLYILSDQNQDFMANHILELVKYIQQYLGTCRAFQQDPTAEDVTAITRAYVEKGSAEVEAFLNQVRQLFYERMLSAKDEAPVDFLENIMQDEMLGMKVKRSD